MSKDNSRAKHKAISGHLYDHSGFSWLKTVVFYLWRRIVAWLVINPSHITDLTIC